MTNINVRIQRSLKHVLFQESQKRDETMGQTLDTFLQVWLSENENTPLKDCRDFDTEKAKRKKRRKELENEQLGAEINPDTKKRMEKEIQRRYWATEGVKRKYPHTIVDTVEEAIRHFGSK